MNELSENWLRTANWENSFDTVRVNDPLGEGRGATLKLANATASYVNFSVLRVLS